MLITIYAKLITAMPSYWRLKYIQPKSEKQRIISNIQKLRSQISDTIPRKKAKDSLLLATWNIRNFDDNRFGYGPRMDESLWYITEILAAFDIIAIQELCEDLEPLERLMSYLDPYYDYIVTDVTEGPGGNRERLGFIYDKEKVNFKGIAGEIVLPYKDLISDVTKSRQFARTPFSCSFQSGWFKFMFSTVHIYYGKSSTNSPEYKRRVKEIKSVAEFLAKRAKKDVYNNILVGDFNIEDFEGETFDALEDQGFEVFRNKVGSNSDLTRFYDQISFIERENQVQLMPSQNGKSQHDVFNFFTNLFTPNQFQDYKKVMRQTIDGGIKEAKTKLEQAKKRLATTQSEKSKEKARKDIEKYKKSVDEMTKTKNDGTELKKYYKTWRTFQLSDHMPLWVELKINYANEYLERIKG